LILRVHTLKTDDVHMKKLLLTGTLLAFIVFQLLGATHLDEFLAHIQATEIRMLEGESIYDTILEVKIEQPLDHRDPDGKSFHQRLYISHIDPERPVVLVTAGYDANYYYTSEIAAELKCNQIMVEHRYFGQSKPDTLDWGYLDTWQAASDHHRIVSMFKSLYPEEWISTGISKGGQSVIYHSYYYPRDVDVRVPYVAPLNYTVEDERIYTFLDQVGDKRVRRKIWKFQRMVLKNQNKYLPAFRQFSEKRGYTYEIVGGLEKAFEYCVLEYDFAYWQWGYVPAKNIPGFAASPMEVIEHMNRVAGFDYFDDEFITENRPFFYQALTEMGYYGYELNRFEAYLQHVDNPVFTFTIPPTVDLTFDPALSLDVERYLASEGDNYIFIYGEYDTWSATAVTSTGNTNSKIFVKEKGSHRTRINNMPAFQKEEIYRTIEEYLQEEP
jgi:hypothetical protein